MQAPLRDGPPELLLCLRSNSAAFMTQAFFDALPVHEWPGRLEVGKAYKQQWGDRWFYCEPTEQAAPWVPITVTP